MYKKILVAIGINEGLDDLLIVKAVGIAKNSVECEVFFIHAVEHISSYGAAYGIFAGMDVEDIMLKESIKSLHALAMKHGVNKENCIARTGAAKFLILDAALEINADLIVTGSHGTHGVRLLLGSTANSVLHGANCDVLAVRIKD